jgi:large subunit ribosomal protein L9
VNFPTPTTMPTIEVILKERIQGLGAEADIVNVKAGFARNFLVPQGKAIEATKGNLRQINSLKARRAEREAKELAEAEAIATRLRKVTIKLTLKTGADGKAFGSITTMDLAKALEDQGPKGLAIDRHAIQLDKPIKQTGKFDIAVKVHPQVEATFKLNVAAESAEASPEGAEHARPETEKRKG